MANPKAPFDLETLMRRFGFAVQEALVILLKADCRNATPVNVLADVEDKHTHRTPVPRPTPDTVGYARDTLGYAGAIQNPEIEPARVLGKAGTILSSERNTHAIATDSAFVYAERHLQ